MTETTTAPVAQVRTLTPDDSVALERIRAAGPAGVGFVTVAPDTLARLGARVIVKAGKDSSGFDLAVVAMAPELSAASASALRFLNTSDRSPWDFGSATVHNLRDVLGYAASKNGRLTITAAGRARLEVL